MKKLRASRRAVIASAAAIVVVGAGAGTVLADTGLFGSSDNPWPYNALGNAPVLAAVGDISCQPDASKTVGEKLTDTCGQGSGSTVRNAAQNATAMQVEKMQPALVAVLGDEQYQNGYYSDFEGSYDKYWGAFKMIQRPSPGNHEFYDNHKQGGVRGLGYFAYFNGIQHKASDGSEIDETVTNADGTDVTDPITGAVIPQQPEPLPNGQAGPYGTTGNGWYSFNLGSWHLISLNVECSDEPGGCSNSPGTWFNQETQWLAQDLNGDHAACTLAYWHQPTFSSTSVTGWMNDSPEGMAAQAWWQLLYAHHATLILNGHDHVYTRFAPLNPSGTPVKNGIREFIVGTGGEGLDTLWDDNNPTDPTPNVQAEEDQYYGVMKLTLRSDSYSWDFESAPNAPSPGSGTYSDTGSATCNGQNQQ